MTTYKDILVLVDKVTKPLQDITQQMKKTTENSEKLKGKLGKLQTSFQKMRPALRNMWSGVKKVTVGLIALVGASGILTRGIAKVTEFADHIDKMSQKIGMSAQEYQKWNYIMSINGGNIDSLSMGFKTLTTQIEGVQKGSKESIKAFSMLGVQVKDSNGKFRSQSEIFNDTIKNLQKIENHVQRDVIANRLFGRSAAELRPLLNMSAEELNKLTDAFDKYGMGLSDEEIKRATKFKDTWTTFTMFLQSQTMKALSNLYPQLQRLLDQIMRHKTEILNVIKFVGRLVYEIIKFTATIAYVIYTVIKSVKQIYGIIKSVFSAIAGFIMNIITTIIGWIKKAIDMINGLVDKLGIVAMFIPGLAQVRMAQNLASVYSKDVPNNTSVRQSQTVNNTSTTTTNNNYFGNTNTYSGMFGMSGAIYAPAR